MEYRAHRTCKSVRFERVKLINMNKCIAWLKCYDGNDTTFASAIGTGVAGFCCSVHEGLESRDSIRKIKKPFPAGVCPKCVPLKLVAMIDFRYTLLMYSYQFCLDKFQTIEFGFLYLNGKKSCSVVLKRSISKIVIPRDHFRNLTKICII